MALVPASSRGGSSLPTASGEGDVLRASAALEAEWTDVIRLLDDGSTLIDATNNDVSVDVGWASAFLKIISGTGIFQLFNSDGAAFVDIRGSSVSMGGTTGTPHIIALSGSLGAALLDGNANLAVHVDTDNLLKFQTLPTSDPAVAGAVWNNAGTLKISAG